MLSVVINTLNEEGLLPNVLKSVKGLADEIVVVDMESSDNTVKVAKKLGATVFSHKRLDYVEPARNFGINKAKGNWVLILDVDEEINPSLCEKIKEVIKSDEFDFVRIPRKNIVFGKWIKYSRWWPDYNIRLFKKGKVTWSDEIHSIPVTEGKSFDLESKEEYAILHNNYSDIDDFVERLLRYTKVQAKQKLASGYRFKWNDLIDKPIQEFLGRYFAGQGYKDGVHGLVLALLQSFSELVLYIRLWGYKDLETNLKDTKSEFVKQGGDIKWWFRKESSWIKKFLAH